MTVRIANYMFLSVVSRVYTENETNSIGSVEALTPCSPKQTYGFQRHSTRSCMAPHEFRSEIEATISLGKLPKYPDAQRA